MRTRADFPPFLMPYRNFVHALLVGSFLGCLPHPGQEAAAGTVSRTAVEKSNVAKAWGTLESLISSNGAQHRKYALAALELITAQPRARKMIEHALASDKEADVRSYAANVLDEGKVRAAIPSLRTALTDSDATVAFAAAKALSDMGDHSGSALFRQVLAGEVKQTPGLIQGALKDAKRTMHDPKELAMIGVKEAAGALLGPASMAITFAEEGLKDKGAAARALSARFLASDKSAASRQTLVQALSDSSPLVRVAACRALALQGDRSSLPLIEALMEGKNEPNRAMAAAAVIRLNARSPRGT